MLGGTKLSIIPVATGIVKPPQKSYTVRQAATSVGSLRYADKSPDTTAKNPQVQQTGMAFGPRYPPILSKMTPAETMPRVGPTAPTNMNKLKAFSCGVFRTWIK